MIESYISNLLFIVWQRIDSSNVLTTELLKLNTKTKIFKDEKIIRNISFTFCF